VAILPAIAELARPLDCELVQDRMKRELTNFLHLLRQHPVLASGGVAQVTGLALATESVHGIRHPDPFFPLRFGRLR